MGRPTGTVCFLFTDVEDSTSRWDRHPGGMRRALARHDTILRGAIEEHGGFVFSTAGDGFAAAFRTPGDGVRAALVAQRRLQSEEWPAEATLLVRMGIHLGAAHERDGDYFGAAVNRAARIMALAHGGQVLVSAPVEELLRDELGDSNTVDLVNLGPHPLRGLARPETVFQAIEVGLASEFPPLRSASPVVGHLPVPQTSFIGRADEVKRVAAELERRRMVTLIGAGGMGKTRLSLEVAATLTTEFPDGMWFVELAPLGQGEAVCHAVASTLSITPEPGKQLTTSIADRLAMRRALLVLDNCEHVIDAVAELVTAIGAAAARTSVLATSREPLGVPGEQVWAMPPLTLKAEAVELFCERARSADHAFEPTDADAELIGVICERLDGMPLAIELAASRVRSMSLPQLATRLADRFRLLQSTRRGGAPERQQTLRATVEWSYRMLKPQEQVLFDRLSVFAGAFALDAVEAVCAAHPLDPGDVLELLSGLVDRSLVVVDRGEHDVRYRLLETLRQYGAERLVQRGEREAVLDAHLDHFVDLAESARRAFEGDACTAGVQQFVSNWDDLRAAFRWAVERGDAESGAALADAPTMFACFWFRFEVGEWAEVMIREGFVSAPVYGAAALFAAFAADREAALDLSARGISLAPDQHDPATSQCLHARLTALSITPGGASQAFEVALQLVDTSDRRPAAARFWRAYSRLVASWMHSNLHPGRASDLLQDALALAAPLANEVLDGYGQLVAGHLVSASGGKIEAMAHFDALAHLAEASGSPHLAVMAPWSVAHVAHALGDAQTAIDAYRSSLRRLYEVRDWVHLWPVVELLCAWGARRGDREFAAVILGHLDAHRIAMSGYQRGRARTAALLAENPTTPAAVALGRRLTRDQLLEHILERL